MTVDTSAPMAIRNPIQPRTVFRLPAVLCGNAIDQERGQTKKHV